jgi:succinate dehydrogenase iron-sulfur subunit
MSVTANAIGECAKVRPASIQLEVISRMNRDFLRAVLTRRPEEPPFAALPKTSPMRFFEKAPAKVER